MHTQPRLAPRADSHHPLPDPVLRRVAADLAAAAAARQAQLDALPAPATPVAVAHRDSVLRILNAIRDAQEDVAAGAYGDCHRCGRRAGPTTDLTRPWAPVCARCATR